MTVSEARDMVDAINKIWDGLCHSVEEVARTFQKMLKEIELLGYALKNTPPREYASRMQKNHLYRERPYKTYRVQSKIQRHQPYCRRIF